VPNSALPLTDRSCRSPGSPDPYVFYESPPDSGYPVDNLVPAPPTDLRWDPAPIRVWNEAEEEDFDYFTVYASAEAEFNQAAEVIGYTSGTSMDVPGNHHQYCNVTTTDLPGNEGEASGILNRSLMSRSSISPRSTDSRRTARIRSTRRQRSHSIFLMLESCGLRSSM